MKYKILADSRL